MKISQSGEQPNPFVGNQNDIGADPTKANNDWEKDLKDLEGPPVPKGKPLKN
jgi:hypothetical protein